ncbi:accessory gene regulator ArgB-like protein [Paenibacillus sp. GCM10027626]|uniref:accessory gene regulator ArgB-like protein n=1 Tax=Paenibacillus sp. GCM10027626 TaxID=3273411 RepID=UPI00363A94D1
MINSLANILAIRIKSKVPEHPASVAVLQYSLLFILNSLSIIVLTMCISLFTGKIFETFVALTAFAVLRQVSGGYHLKSGLLCIIISTTVIVLLSFTDCNSTVTMSLNIASAILVLMFAPSRIERQTRIPARYFPLLKVMALCLIIISGVISYPVLAMTFFAQSLTLIRIGR